MVDDIVTGITSKLHSTFEGYNVDDVNVEQDLVKPCFFIKLLTMINTPLVGKRKKRAYPFDIHYFPEDETDNVAMMEVGEKLTDSLEYIALLNGNVLRGREMTCEIIDGVLHFYVTYGVILNDTSKDDAMDDIRAEVSI